MDISRTFAIIFSIINVLGIVWFLESLKQSTLVSGAVAVICALTLALVPRRLVSDNNNLRLFLLVLCVVGISAILFLISQDYQRTYGPDFGAITLRSIFAATLLSMGIKIFHKT
ncbi:MAG: hypothetical protein LJE58_09760 [Thiogranum sp.]|jgi:hypothetical protein|nr:hypothetical protein [Thiogranum sp.]